MKIFICEHACSPLVSSGIVSASDGFRGDIMLRALLADISRIDALEVTVLRDQMPGFSDVPSSITMMPVQNYGAMDIIDECMQKADAIWPLAPESNGLLESISRKATHHKKILLGSTRDAVHMAGSKYRTSQALRAWGIPVVPTYRPQATLPVNAHGWVVKPDDGAGCSDTHIFSHPMLAKEWIAAQKQGDYVLQPYIVGRPCSLSLLCSEVDVFVMGRNDHRMAVFNNQFHYMGSIINSIDDASGELEALTRRVVAAIPGMWGYVGIDLIVTDHGPVVLEVNPRMTMSHTGLHASIGANPAKLLLDMLHTGHCGVPLAHKSRQVSVDINACQDGAGVVV